VSHHDRREVACCIERVLRREPAAVADAISELEAARDRAAARLMFEFAAEIQEQIRGLRWISQPQKLALLDPEDGDFAAVAGEVEVVISLRGGRMADRQVRVLGHVPSQSSPHGGEGARVLRRVPSQPSPHGGEGAREWVVVAQRNAEVMARIHEAGALGPLGWRRPRN
jgi:excinuclease UvrABC nuclease subunit